MTGSVKNVDRQQVQRSVKGPTPSSTTVPDAPPYPPMHRLLFPLNDTIVVALPSSDSEAHTPTRVAQITLKATRPESVETITTYYLVRHDLTVCAPKLCHARRH
ncbi:hypothetical protein C8Q76DRAFT_723970 [Earliella scabrosa]|nr:hypothetical protein C8Q76DRAFT_723970 [Earliella scabrosa]